MDYIPVTTTEAHKVAVVEHKGKIGILQDPLLLKDLCCQYLAS